MARTYATIDAGIWSDEEFCALTAGAQRTYFMLITQPDITAAGTLALTMRRWSKTCSERDLDVWLAELEDARFVLIDEDTEEVLVRTFVKWDGGYKHSKRCLAVVANARALRSDTLRKAVADELAKLGVTDPNLVRTDRDSIGISEAFDSRRFPVKLGDHRPEPETTLQESDPSPSEPDVEPSRFCTAHPKGTEKPCGPCGTAGLRWQAWAKRQERRRRALEQRQSGAILTELAEARAQAVPRPPDLAVVAGVSRVTPQDQKLNEETNHAS